MVGIGGARDRDEGRIPGHQPGQAKLSGGAGNLCRQGLETGQQLQVGGQRLPLEARHGGAHVAELSDEAKGAAEAKRLLGKA